jgi:GNAT superfamily N-acetyltransferase
VIRTRTAGPEDAAVVAGLIAGGFETYRAWAAAGWAPPPTETAEEIARIARRLGDPDTWCLLAEEDGEPVGHVSFLPAQSLDGLAHLWHLFVRTEWWGAGVAGRLLAEAVSEARRRGYARMRLFTPRDHGRARAFYRREGWSQIGASRYEPELALELVEYVREL